MTATLDDWLRVIDSYYLENFIMEGGSAFKLVLAGDAGGSKVALEHLRRKAEERNCLYVQVSAAETRVDRIDQVFFAISRQIDWNALMILDGIRFLRERGYLMPEDTELSDTETIASANGLIPEELLRELRRATTDEIVQDRDMCKEFRTAISQLRKAQFFPRNVSPSDTETISSWLRGEKVGASALRDLRIYSKINRQNARDLLRAFAHWLARSIGKGLVVGIDLSALLAVRPRGMDDDLNTLHYSRSSLLDAYEVLRQFIDETDEITHCLICAAAPDAIETDEKRSIFGYYALQSRLFSEVHDVSRQDLLAAMVRVGESGASDE